MLVGYGTRKGNLDEVLETQVRRLRCREWDNVEPAFFRVSKPTIQESLDKLVAAGADEIVVVPYYIAEGTLTKELIPQKLGIDCECGTVEIDGKEVTIHMAPAFGVTRDLTDIICDRIADAGGDRDCGILVLGHGTRYTSLANMYVVKINAERLEAIGYKNVAYAFNEFCEPSIKDALNLLESKGVTKIIAIPLFVAMGLHLGEEIPEQIGIPAYSDGGEITLNGRTIEVRYTRPMEADPRLLDNVEAKIKEFLGD